MTRLVRVYVTHPKTHLVPPHVLCQHWMRSLALREPLRERRVRRHLLSLHNTKHGVSLVCLFGEGGL